MERVMLAVLVVPVVVYGGEIDWQKDYGEAKQKSAESGRIMMLLFTREGNPACVRFKEDTLAEPAVKGALQGVLAVEMKPADAAAQQLAGRFAVDRAPTTFFLDKEEGVLAALVGCVPAEDFVDAVHEAGEALQQYKSRSEAYAKSPNARSAVELVEQYVRRKQPGKVAEVLPKARELVEKGDAIDVPPLTSAEHGKGGGISADDKAVLNARLYIAEAFALLDTADKPDEVLALLKKAEDAAGKADPETASRAAFLRGVLNLEIDRLEEGAAVLEALVRKYPKSTWGEMAKKYAEETRKEIDRRKAEAPRRGPEAGSVQGKARR